jgi:hypothetical protein
VDELDVNEPKKKSGVLKWVLIGCGSLLALAVVVICIGVYILSRSFSTDPAKAEAAAQEMLQFEKPAGFSGTFSMSLAGAKAAMLTAGGGSGRGSIFLLTFPKGNANSEAVQQQVRVAMDRRGQGQMITTEQLPNETFQVRGKDIVAQVGVVNRGQTDGKSRQYTLTLDGQSGALVLLTIAASETTATHEWVQKFLDSVK